ncbi:hypothetical protein JYP49_05590 [Nitratireductor aquimarinus]|uniref:hypothetical protein n=1 Tax=Nitratireductor TaxID=245876 RepID=UPI0019D40309|nr:MULTISPECIES: hypothetical protein [Nitratireductor]MBN7776718.1 hypothetical protein [Nitratireductor pacificus]MBN7780052.1 hypothetical protein [Nitratireductor pacificus]MBN7788859.1 hypothetical protein [Nitratireductor aquimarinus]MBY6098927.1 hypothetical protein [Nitratireductor aquimarinus]MCA1259413.1 hypothetical protein [Nitratireductor aquimarinus]
MSIRPTFDNIDTWLATKPAGHFIIERWGVGFAINVHRNGAPVETILAKTPGEVNQLRQKLSDAGLCGYVSGGA